MLLHKSNHTVFGLPQLIFSNGETGLYGAQDLHLLSESNKCHFCGIFHFGVDKVIHLTNLRARHLTQQNQMLLAFYGCS